MNRYLKTHFYGSYLPCSYAVFGEIMPEKISSQLNTSLFKGTIVTSPNNPDGTGFQTVASNFA
jgi:hypothetical protein